MSTIKDLKENNDSDLEIVVKEKKDDCDPMGKVLYEGCLGNCPEKLDELTVEPWQSWSTGKWILQHYKQSA